MTDIDPSRHDWASDRMYDSAIVEHGFARHMRDYDVIVDVPAARRDGTGSYISGRFRYRFTHCVEAHVQTQLQPETWLRSWGDEFTSYSAWESAGAPDGFVWGVGWADAEPGPSLDASSRSAAGWAGRLDRPMHEMRIETNAYLLRLVCHGLRIEQLAVGDPSAAGMRTIAHG